MGLGRKAPPQAEVFGALANRGFVEMFREASLKVKLGRVAEAIFPHGSFPPSLPFVRKGEVFDPLADIRGSPFTEIWAAAPS